MILCFISNPVVKCANMLVIPSFIAYPVYPFHSSRRTLIHQRTVCFSVFQSVHMYINHAYYDTEQPIARVQKVLRVSPFANWCVLITEYIIY